MKRPLTIDMRKATRFGDVRKNLTEAQLAGVGAVATQAMINREYGPQGLALLADGKKRWPGLVQGTATRIKTLDAGVKGSASSRAGCGG